MKRWTAGELWPLVLTKAQRTTLTVLSDAIIPADSSSPSASEVGVVEFMDEWLSAPYPKQQADREVILPGLIWFEGESQRRFGREPTQLDEWQLCSILDDICWQARAAPELATAASFFALLRDLVVGGFYTTPEGRADLQYVGNTPLARFDGPPLAVLQKVGLA